MLILWRFLIGHYLKVTAVCVTAFIGILLTMRLDEIAHFAALGATITEIASFAWHQIPYVFPIALPVSCLISSMILFQGLSKTHELTALRSCGIGVREILFPILMAAFLLSAANFYVVSEVATQSHLTANILKSKLRAINPLLLLHNKHLMRLKGVYFKAMGPSRVGEFANDVILGIPNKKSGRISVIIAKQMITDPVAFIGNDISLISVLSHEQSEAFDPLIVENIEHSATAVNDFSDLLQKKEGKIGGDNLRMSMLLVRLKEQREALRLAKEKLQNDEVKNLRHQVSMGFSEMARRGSLALAVLTFTLMGSAFGMSVGRGHSYRSLYTVIILATLFIVAFFTAKGLEKNWIAATALYMVPHGVIVITSLLFLNRMSRGVET